MFNMITLPFRQRILIALTVMVFVLAFLVRFINLNYNSPFNDEAIYVVVGQTGLFLGDWVSYNAASWMAGHPYFYPSITAIAYKIGGIAQSRFVNVAFGILTLYTIYQIIIILYERGNKKLFPGLITIALLGITPIGVYVSRLATYDAPSFFFIFLGLYFISIANLTKFNFEQTARFYFLAALSIFLAVGFKIISAIYVPFFVLYSYFEIKNKKILSGEIETNDATLLNKSADLDKPSEVEFDSNLPGQEEESGRIYESDVQSKGVAANFTTWDIHEKESESPFTSEKENTADWFKYFLVPLSILFAIYLFFNFSHIYAYYVSQQTPLNISTRLEVLTRFWKEIYLIVPFWLVGSLGLVLSKNKKKLLFLSLGVFIPVIFHLVFKNAPSLDKHTYLTSAFMSIVAGLGIGKIIDFTDNKVFKTVVSSALVLSLIVFWVSAYKTLPKYNNLWRDTTKPQSFISKEVDSGDRVLVESGASMVLAASQRDFPTNVITFDWFEYGGLQGREAYIRAVDDGYFNFIQLETPDNPKLKRNDELSKVIGLIVQFMRKEYKLVYEEDGYLIYKRTY